MYTGSYYPQQTNNAGIGVRVGVGSDDKSALINARDVPLRGPTTTMRIPRPHANGHERFMTARQVIRFEIKEHGRASRKNKGDDGQRLLALKGRNFRYFSTSDSETAFVTRHKWRKTERKIERKNQKEAWAAKAHKRLPYFRMETS